MSLVQAYRSGHNGRPGWRLALTYDEDLVARLKSSIPAADRAWDPDRVEWWISEDRTPELLALVPSFDVFLNQPQLF